MKTALLDLNILIALLWPAHEHHEAAHRWFGTRRKARWATCALTQLGFVRLLSNPSFSRDALSLKDAALLLSTNLAHPNHLFWVEDLSVPEVLDAIPRLLQGHQQLTDAYLLALARHHDGVLATFDRGLETLDWMGDVGARTGQHPELKDAGPPAPRSPQPARADRMRPA